MATSNGGRYTCFGPKIGDVAIISLALYRRLLPPYEELLRRCNSRSGSSVSVRRDTLRPLAVVVVSDRDAELLSLI